MKKHMREKNYPHSVKNRLGEDTFIAGLQLYSDSTVVNLKGGSVHPVYLCSLNHTYSEKIKCIVTVAYIPSHELQLLLILLV